VNLSGTAAASGPSGTAGASTVVPSQSSEDVSGALSPNQLNPFKSERSTFAPQRWVQVYSTRPGAALSSVDASAGGSGAGGAGAGGGASTVTGGGAVGGDARTAVDGVGMGMRRSSSPTHVVGPGGAAAAAGDAPVQLPLGGYQASSPTSSMMPPDAAAMASLSLQSSSSVESEDVVVGNIVGARGVYWTSLCEPAILPLYTEVVPSAADIRDYQFGFYSLTVPSDPMDVIKRIVGYRLDLDFQIVSVDEAVLESLFGNYGLKVVYCLSLGPRFHVVYADPLEKQLTVRGYHKQPRSIEQVCTFGLWEPLLAAPVYVQRPLVSFSTGRDAVLRGYGKLDFIACSSDDPELSDDSQLRYNVQLFLVLPSTTFLLQHGSTSTGASNAAPGAAGRGLMTPALALPLTFVTATSAPAPAPGATSMATALSSSTATVTSVPPSVATAAAASVSAPASATAAGTTAAAAAGGAIALGSHQAASAGVGGGSSGVVVTTHQASGTPGAGSSAAGTGAGASAGADAGMSSTDSAHEALVQQFQRFIDALHTRFGAKVCH
jgi:hypothetical protein